MSLCSTFETRRKEFKMGDVRPKLAETLIKAIEQLRGIHVPDGYVMQMENLIKQLDETCVVAVVGRVKAGKSTFVNALLGADDLAPVGVTEKTATINYFRWGTPTSPDFPVRCKRKNSSILEPQNRTFLESLQGNDSETLHRAEEIEYLEYLLTHPFLQQVTLVDTPGTESAVNDHQNVTADYLRLFGQLRGQHEPTTRRRDSSADAVIYLIGNVSLTTDQKILQEFATLTGGRSQATNAIGVMAKIDLQDDFPKGGPMARAVKCASQLKEQLNTVIPVSAGLQQALDRLQANNWAGLSRIGETLHRLDSKQLEELLLGAELYLEGWDTINSLVSSTERKELLGTLEWTVFRTIVKVAEAANWNVEATVKRLTELAGFGHLRLLLEQRFFERGQLIRGYRIINDAFKIVEEIRHSYIPVLRNKDDEEKKRKTQFLAFLQKVNTLGIGNADVRRELDEFVRTHSITNHAEQAEKVLEQIGRNLSRMYYDYALHAVPEDLEALQLLDNHPSLFSGPEVDELRTLFGRNGMEIALRLQLEHMSTESIHSRSQYWHSVRLKEKPPISVIAKRATFSYAHLLNEIRMRPQLPEQR